MKTLTVDELHNQIQENKKLFLIDVRSPAEYQAGHIPQAMNCPLECVDAHSLKQLEQEGEVVFICRSGGRATKACEQVQASGLEQVSVLTGGTEGWRKAGYDVRAEGKTMMSIERQVRIGAGTLVLLGVALGLTVTPGFFYLSGFVGAGLVFAGITDWCGMGLLLAKMPWNSLKRKSCCRTKTSCCSSSKEKTSCQSN